MKKRAVGYCRISTLMQVDNTSLKDQEDKIRMYAKLHDIVIDEMFIDKAVSGKSTDRPEYDKMMDYIKENDIVLLFTGWDNFYGKEEYYTEHPVVSRELAELLIKKKIKMLGMDMPSPDRDNYEIHNVLFENDIFLLENLTNLNKLLYNEEIQLFAQPLKVQSEASLVRAVAIYQGY